MPNYFVEWRKKNKPVDGVAQDDTVTNTTVRASSPEEALEIALASDLPPEGVYKDAPTVSEVGA